MAYPGVPMAARKPRTSTARLRRAHAIGAAAWALLVIPTVVWWRESITWLVFISIYTVIVDHLGAWQAARAEDAARPDN